MDKRIYSSGQTFRQALEDVIRDRSRQRGVPQDRLRRQIAFDRFLARVFIESQSPWLLKGGYALEFRLKEIARSTTDIDLSVPSLQGTTPQKIREMLQANTRRDLEDWFEFYIGEGEKEIQQAHYVGWKFHVEAHLGGRLFSAFQVDVAIGDVVISEPEWETGAESLSFAGFEPARVAVYPKDQHFAEKIHSYSYPKEIRTPSRIKDLVDLILLIDGGLPAPDIMQKAIAATFERRKTHSVPKNLPKPPLDWKEGYESEAAKCGASQKIFDDAINFLEQYWQTLY